MQAPIGSGEPLAEGRAVAAIGDDAVDGAGASEELAALGAHPATANTRTMRRTFGMPLPPRLASHVRLARATPTRRRLRYPSRHARSHNRTMTDRDAASDAVLDAPPSFDPRRLPQSRDAEERARRAVREGSDVGLSEKPGARRCWGTQRGLNLGSRRRSAHRVADAAVLRSFADLASGEPAAGRRR